MVSAMVSALLFARLRPTTLRVFAVGAVLALAACRDTESAASIAPTPRLSRSAQLEVSPALAGDSVITVSLRVLNPGAVAIASITASIDFDTTRVRYLSEVSLGDGALRAAHAERGRVVIAAAHATGFAEPILAQLRFVARDSAAIRSLQLRISELHSADAHDARTQLTISPTVVIK